MRFVMFGQNVPPSIVNVDLATRRSKYSGDFTGFCIPSTEIRIAAGGPTSAAAGDRVHQGRVEAATGGRFLVPGHGTDVISIRWARLARTSEGVVFGMSSACCIWAANAQFVLVEIPGRTDPFEDRSLT
jgi:hypothetical protein